MDGLSKGRFLVIGAGYAGLAAAIELKSNGFEVEVIEAVEKLTTQGQSTSQELQRNTDNPRRYSSDWFKRQQNYHKMGQYSRQHRSYLRPAKTYDYAQLIR